MPKYTFSETLHFFGEKIESFPSNENINEGSVELVIDDVPIAIRKGMFEESLIFEIAMGLIVQPLWQEHLKELTSSNYLGVNTSGCTLACNPSGSILSLKAVTTPGSTPQESWELLHRIISVSRAWGETLTLWDEIIPLQPTGKIKE